MLTLFESDCRVQNGSNLSHVMYDKIRHLRSIINLWLCLYIIIWKHPWHGSRFFTPMARQKLHPLILCLDVQLQLCHAVSTESDIIDMTCCFQSPMATCCDLVFVHGILTFTIYDIPWYYLHIGLAHTVSKWFWTLSIAEVLISGLFLIKLIQFCHVPVQERLSSVWEALWSRKQSNRPVFLREPSPLQLLELH